MIEKGCCSRRVLDYVGMDKLQRAKKTFEKAAKHGGDADHAITVTAAGLADLAEGLIGLREDIEMIKALLRRTR